MMCGGSRGPHAEPLPLPYHPNSLFQSAESTKISTATNPHLTRYPPSSPTLTNPEITITLGDRRFNPAMKIYYIGIVRNAPKPAHELVSVKELSSFSFFQRTPVSEFLTLFSGTVAERIQPMSRQDIEEQSYTFHVYGRSEGIAGVIISDHEYPKLIAHKLLSQVVDDFLTLHPRSKWAEGTPKLELPVLGEYIVKYQDPRQADSIMRIQQELDETKIVLHKTIESVLERGEKIDSLVQRSEGLSSASKMFYTQAKKQNSCCIIT